MKKLLLILLCVPLIGLGQNISDDFPKGYLEPETIMDWVDTTGGYHSFSPIGFNESGEIAYRITYDLNDGMGYYYDKIIIQSYGQGFRSGDIRIIDEFILFQSYGGDSELIDEFLDNPWEEKYSLIHKFLFQWGIVESF